MPMKYALVATQAEPPKIAPAIIAIKGTFAPQGMNVVVMMVMRRFVFNRSGCHNTGNAAARADEHRDEGFAGKTEFAENSVKDECDTRHITAAFKDSEQQEQNEHLRNKAENSTDTCNYTVVDKACKPIGCACFFKTFAHKHGNTLYPNAVCGGIGFIESVFLKVFNGINISHADGLIFLCVFGDRGIINGHFVYRKSFLILNADGCGCVLALGLVCFEFGKHFVGIEIFGFSVEINKCAGSVHCVAVIFGSFVICL